MLQVVCELFAAAASEHLVCRFVLFCFVFVVVYEHLVCHNSNNDDLL